jgi:hypothetical protein
MLARFAKMSLCSLAVVLMTGCSLNGVVNGLANGAGIDVNSLLEGVDLDALVQGWLGA